MRKYQTNWEIDNVCKIKRVRQIWIIFVTSKRKKISSFFFGGRENCSFFRDVTTGQTLTKNAMNYANGNKYSGHTATTTTAKSSAWISILWIFEWYLTMPYKNYATNKIHVNCAWLCVRRFYSRDFNRYCHCWCAFGFCCRRTLCVAYLFALCRQR